MGKHLLSANLAAAATLLLATSASAAINVSQGPTGNYNADVAAFSNANVVCGFDVACAAGFNFTYTGAGTGVTSGSPPGVAQPPSDTTSFVAVKSGGAATLTSTNILTNLSFYMGSPDTYNSISFYNGNTFIQTFTGASFTGVVGGDQGVGQRVFFNFTGGEQVNKVVFASSENSFEFDRVGVTLGAVPEPATWATMITGFGMMGMMMRRRRRTVAVTA